jgi:hypothetical protein
MNDTATEGIEATICDACQLVPLSHLHLDADEPTSGWARHFAERGVEVVLDDLGRPSVPRRVLGELLAERREREARAAEELAQRATAHRPPVPAGLPVVEGSTPFESLVAAGGHVSVQEEFGGGRVSPSQEFMDAQFAEARQLEAIAQAEREAVENAQRVLEGRDT